MVPTVKNMTDDDIVAIAAYLASLDPNAATPAKSDDRRGDKRRESTVEADLRSAFSVGNMRWSAALLIATAGAAACGGTAPSPTTGLTGIVVRGPITPVCRVDVPCDAPFSAGFTVQRAGRQVAQFQSDSAGQFTVFLDPGAYTVVPNADAPLLSPKAQIKSVTVADTGRLTVVSLTFDTGIR